MRNRIAMATMATFALMAFGTSAAYAAEPSSTSFSPPSSGSTAGLGESKIGGGYSYTYDAVDRSSVLNYIDMTQVIGSCTGVGSSPTTCNITQGKSVQVTIGLTMNATRGAIAGSLNMTSSYTVTTTQGCTGTVSNGQTLKAFPRGTRYKYHVRKRSFNTITGTSTYTTSPDWSYAFNPTPDQIACGI